MASSYSELYSDFKDQVKVYVEKLDVTPMSFMRLFTRAMQQFQRDTEYKEKLFTQTSNTSEFTLPDDVDRLIEIKDANGYLMLSQSPDQFNRYLEEAPAFYQDGYTDYTNRLDWDRATFPYIYTIWNRAVNIYPAYTETTINYRYIPELSAISSTSPDWEDWFTDEDAFETQFIAQTVPVEFAVFEQAFLNYAIGQYIKTQGNRNYQIFDKLYQTDVAIAKEKKPTYFKQGLIPYKWR